MAIMTILGAFILKLIEKEIEAWIPQAAPFLVRYAVSKLPAAEQARYAKEWSADLEAIPGELSKLAFALGFVKAAFLMNLELRRQHEVVQAMYRTKGKVVFLVLQDEILTRTKHERIGQLLKITLKGGLDAPFVVRLLTASVVRRK
jgi:hypothetical protein